MALRTLVLALDTSTDRGSLALAWADDGAIDLLHERAYDAEPGHAERLLPELEALFEAAGLRPAGLGAVAAGVGPGSFSGLRVGLATAKALALATGARAVGVTSLAALAAASGATAGLVVAALDARRDEAFVAAYRAGDWAEPAEAPRLLSTADARAWARALPGPRTLVGTGASLLDAGPAAAPARPPAGAVAALAAAAIARGAPPPVEPLYVRPPNATPPAPRR